MVKILPADTEICHLYIDGQKSRHQISNMFHVSGTRIRLILLKNNVKLRTIKEASKLTSQYLQGKRAIRLASGLNQPNCKTISIRETKTKPIRRFEIFARDGFRCQYCGRTPSDSIKLIVEHIIPKSQGGNSESANLITACNSCNVSKGNKMLLTKSKQIPSFMAITTLNQARRRRATKQEAGG